MSIDSLIADARAARLADDFERAKNLCGVYLSLNPDAPEAMSLFGLCRVESGDMSGAALIEKAATARPNDGVIALDLSTLRERQGDFREALKAASRAAELAPHRFEGWAQLGKLLGMGGRFAEAAEALATALRIRPEHAGVARLLAGAGVEAGDMARARTGIEALEKLTPQSPDAIRFRLHYERLRGDWSALADVATRWLANDQNAEEPRLALAHALSKQGFYDRAAEVYAPLARRANFVERPAHLAALGRYALGARRLDDAAKLFDEARRLDSGNAEASYGLARIALFRGNLDGAAGNARKAIRTDPQHADAWGLLAEATRGAIDDAELLALRDLAGAQNLASDARAIASFALGDVLHARKDVDGAFGAWRSANEARRTEAGLIGGGYDRERQTARTRRLADWFGAGLGQAAASSAEAPPTPQGFTPIFIVGMPRSGTTLLETALCAHPLVAGAGESPAMPFVLDQFEAWATAVHWEGADLPADRLSEWRQTYFRETRRFAAGDGAFVTDKQPSNFLAVGLIARMIPDARIILIRRNPVETGLSIYRRNFAVNAWPFANDLGDIGHYLGEQARLCRFWAESLGARLAIVQYEDLVEDFEGEMKRILAHCGLDWDAACATPENATREILTFSASQVREKVSADRGRSADRYAAYLEPLRDALAAAGVDLQTGAMRGPARA